MQWRGWARTVAVAVSRATASPSEGGEPEEGGYVQLAPLVAKFMGGKRHCKELELTLCRLLAYDERSVGQPLKLRASDQERHWRRADS